MWRAGDCWHRGLQRRAQRRRPPARRRPPPQRWRQQRAAARRGAAVVITSALTSGGAATHPVTFERGREYRVAASPSRSQTNYISIGLSRALSEQVSASLNLGLYRTESSVQQSRIACPLQISLCRAGLLPYIILQGQADSAANGLQYSSTYNYRFDETSSFSFSSGTQQTPSGAGTVTRGQTLNLGASRAFSETLNGSMGYALSRSKFQGTSARGTAAQRSFSISISKQLAPQLSLQAGYQWAQSNNVGADNTAQSNSVSVSLKYDWAKLDETR